MIELANTTNTLLTEIRDRNFNQKNVAMTYALALRSSEATDWGEVNRAIIERWSFSGLEAVKKAAWKIAGGGRPDERHSVTRRREQSLLERQHKAVQIGNPAPSLGGRGRKGEACWNE